MVHSLHPLSSLAPAIVGLLLVVVAGAVIIVLARRAVTGRPTTRIYGRALEELRRLHEGGDLTEEEYRRALASMRRSLIEDASDTTLENDVEIR